MIKKIIGLVMCFMAIGAFLHAQDHGHLLHKTAIDSVKQHTNSTKDEGFIFIFNHVKDVNNIMGNGDAQEYISYWITKEEIDSVLLTANINETEPDWKKLEQVIQKKFDNYYSERTITGAKMRWYAVKKNGPEFAKYLVKNVSRYEGLHDTYRLSNNAWDVFKNTSNEADLKIAMQWCQLILNKEPDNANVTDTYANILYKLGEKDKALEWEKKAVTLDPNHTEIRANYEKMLQGLKTWP